MCSNSPREARVSREAAAQPVSNYLRLCRKLRGVSFQALEINHDRNKDNEENKAKPFKYVYVCACVHVHSQGTKYRQGIIHMPMCNPNKT